LLLPWRPWATSESLDAVPDFSEEDLSDITVLIPARNEAGVIETTLSGVKAQGDGLNIILVDDQSVDGTVRVAKTCAKKNLHVVSGTSPQEGWSGKLWALEQGLRQVDTELLLLLDADIELKPGILQTLREKMRKDGLQLISLMVTLRMVSFWERLLMPALSLPPLQFHISVCCRGCRGLYFRQNGSNQRNRGLWCPAKRTD